ncbi:tetratricopeptide repeat protein [Mucilaginibacter sp. UR6-11]|uniref:tetratricopeptide repeat protein n=1 Tax=Mucilaginibacter sp. UR6-11 TaxID=1435644 RepID=UPI001E4C69FD|nr:tetratricopeptide repeat protein [Mucilaginibacter sp. UR6-11]MCC8423360.1 tetratricopeptide repeat protein [Mucilaginibacter sp. UR6-11]
MKYLTICLLLLITGVRFSYGQQTRKTDDALLLDYYQNQRFTEALSYLKSVYTEPVTDKKELSTLAYTAAMANKLTDAEAFYQRIYDMDTTNITALYNIAGINHRRGNAAKAAAYYIKFTLKDTTNFLVYKQLARISSEKADLTGQLHYLQKANKIDPAEFDVASDLSDRYVQLGQLAVAGNVLNLALAADPENIVLLQSLLKLYSAQKRWAETISTGEKLLQLGDVAISTVNKLGIAYYQLKNYECGITTLLSLPAALQTETTTYFIAACYKELKDPQKAIIYFNKAIKLSIPAATATYYSEMADSYETINQLKKAQAAYQKALLYQENPLTYYYLATLLDTRLKDKRTALKYFKKYIVSKPDKKQQAYVDYSKERIAALRAK